ncbi:hypothetical protein [Flavisericum labens]|uniref:hypothetical protein n=1 Tax=Flavisericum labens TaxID=3377112 RepID=UPI00387AE2A1
MKYFNLFTVLFLVLVLSCNKSSKSAKQEVQKSVQVENTPTAPVPSTSPVETQNSTGQVFHYTCLKGCSGGANTAVNCKTCGNLLTHNAAYHNKPSSAPFAGPYNNAPNNPTSKASGVMHYICSNGCAGGSGSAGTCNTCGATLTHNTAYHQ